MPCKEQCLTLAVIHSGETRARDGAYGTEERGCRTVYRARS